MIRKKCVKIDKERQNFFEILGFLSYEWENSAEKPSWKIQNILMSDYLYYEGAIFFNSVMIKKKLNDRTNQSKI